MASIAEPAAPARPEAPRPEARPTEARPVAPVASLAEPFPTLSMPARRRLASMLVGDSPPFVPLTVEQYVQMAEAGILPTTAAVELLDGLLVHKDRRDGEECGMTVGALHVFVGLELLDLLNRKLAQLPFHARRQAPIGLPPSSAPEPDLSIAAGKRSDYVGRLPEPADLVAVFEVSQASLRGDRAEKGERYAAAGIPVYWIVNLVDRTIEVRSKPIPAQAAYARSEVFDRGAVISLNLGDAGAVEVPVAEFLPE